ncbi:MAG: YqgE/AlgH family protein [Thiolinea sp.]
MEAISTLRNHLLIAMPGMNDTYFDHTVTLICQHDEQGAFGVMINRPLQLTVGELLAQLDITVDDPGIAGQTALSGGPVQSEQGFVLHNGNREWDSTLHIDDNTSITSSKDILVDLASGNGPERFILLLGCAGWHPGQLEEEIKANSWLTCPADQAILFDMPYPHRWKGAASTLGIDVRLLTADAGHA